MNPEDDPAQVEVYDSQMGMLRDIKKENEDIIKTLELTNNQTLIEFGTGTGNFAIDAARHCKKVYAIDVSPRINCSPNWASSGYLKKCFWPLRSCLGYLVLSLQ